MKLSERMSIVADRWQEKQYPAEVTGGLRGYSAEVSHLEGLKEYAQHKPECWKNQALSGLGVGGDLASCTCGLDKALGGES